MVVRMRHTRSHTKNRRSHHALSGGTLAICQKCKGKHIKHQICPNCGTYRGKAYLDVLAKLSKKDRKEKEKELKTKEEKKPLTPEPLSKK